MAAEEEDANDKEEKEEEAYDSERIASPMAEGAADAAIPGSSMDSATVVPGGLPTPGTAPAGALQPQVDWQAPQGLTTLASRSPPNSTPLPPHKRRKTEEGDDPDETALGLCGRCTKVLPSTRFSDEEWAKAIATAQPQGDTMPAMCLGCVEQKTAEEAAKAAERAAKAAEAASKPINQLSLKELKQELTTLGISFNTFVEKGEFREALNKARGEGEESVAVEENEEAAALLFATPSSCGDPAHREEEVALPSAPPGQDRRTRSMTPPLRRRSRKEQAVIYR